MSRVQLEFDLGDSPGRPTPKSDDADDIFVVVKPDAIAWADSRRIANAFLSRLDVKEDLRPFHVTFHGLGKYRRLSKTFLAEKFEALSTVFFKPFWLTFDKVMSFSRSMGKPPLVLCASQPCVAFFDLYHRIIQAQLPPGVELKTAPAITPHMTLFYSYRTIALQDVNPPVRWLVRQFSIVRSHTGKCEHEELWTWPPVDA